MLQASLGTSSATSLGTSSATSRGTSRGTGSGSRLGTGSSLGTSRSSSEDYNQKIIDFIENMYDNSYREKISNLNNLNNYNINYLLLLRVILISWNMFSSKSFKFLV